MAGKPASAAAAAAAAYTLVTGANRGLGLQLCRELVAEGRPVMLVARSQDKAEAARQQLVEENAAAAPLVVPLSADVGKPAEVTALAAVVQARLAADGARLVALVNNAGMLRDEWSEAALAEHMASNVLGPVRLMRLLHAPLAAAGGRVVNVSSGLGSWKYVPDVYRPQLEGAARAEDVVSLPFVADAGKDEKGEQVQNLCYKVSKAALNRAVQLLAADDTAFGGVPVAAVCPGWVRTDMGGQSATRSHSEGVASIRAMLDHPAPMPSGTFTRDGAELPW